MISFKSCHFEHLHSARLHSVSWALLLGKCTSLLHASSTPYLCNAILAFTDCLSGTAYAQVPARPAAAKRPATAAAAAPAAKKIKQDEDGDEQNVLFVSTQVTCCQLVQGRLCSF